MRRVSIQRDVGLDRDGFPLAYFLVEKACHLDAALRHGIENGASNFSFTSGRARMRLMCSANLFVTSGGVPAGARKPYQL